jgi:predicted ATPase
MPTGTNFDENKRLRVLFTGGPATGKSTLIEGLTSLGYRCYPEEIRLLTDEILQSHPTLPDNENPLLMAEDSLDFNRRLLGQRLRQWRDFEVREEALAFFDRGLPDVLAYMDAFGQPYPGNFEQLCQWHRYDCVFLTPIWPEIFKNDKQRLESVETAYQTESHLIDTYRRYDYELIAIPLLPLEDRIRFVLDYLKGRKLL